MRNRIVGAGVVAALAALLLAGCVDAPEPTPGPTTEPTSGPVEPVEPSAPELDLEGTAGANLEYFDAVNAELVAAGGALDGRAFIDNLVSAGFPKTDMEVTNDVTAINGTADNIQFAVRLNGGCLIGQYGNVGYQSTTAPLLATGRCLVGQTRLIDW
jgi:hypothetical protein